MVDWSTLTLYGALSVLVFTLLTVCKAKFAKRKCVVSVWKDPRTQQTDRRHRGALEEESHPN